MPKNALSNVRPSVSDRFGPKAISARDQPKRPVSGKAPLSRTMKGRR